MNDRLKELVTRAVARNLMFRDNDAPDGTFSGKLLELMDHYGGHPESPYADAREWVMLGLPAEVVGHFLAAGGTLPPGKSHLALWVGQKGNPLLGAF